MNHHSHSHSHWPPYTPADIPHPNPIPEGEGEERPAHSHPHTHPPAKTSAPSCSGCACSSAAGEGDGHEHGALPAWPRIAAALALALGAEAAHWGGQEVLGMALALGAIALSGLQVYRLGLSDLRRLRLGINALMAVAVTGAFAIGQWPEAAMVMALYVAAERLEHAAMDRARQAVRSLLDSAPAMADVLGLDQSITRMPVDAVPAGVWVRIAPGARVPLDGQITEGHSSVNQAPITGESRWVDKTVGDLLYAGSINQHGALVMQVTARAGDTLLARICSAVEQAQAEKAPMQRFIDRFAAVYTPLVFVLALALAALAPVLMGWTLQQALYQALALLVIACPCALVISTPVTIVSALTAAARGGVLLKDAKALEAARQVRAIALDKTGTLTTGAPTLVHWQCLGDIPAPDCAAMALALAQGSDHPVSRAIAAGLIQEAVAPNVPAPTVPTLPTVTALTALPGLGVQAQINEKTYVLGNQRLIKQMGLMTPALADGLQAHSTQGCSVTVLAQAQQVLALFAVSDTLRPQARQAITQLQALGLPTLVLSGDNQATVSAIAADAGITEAQGDLLPQDKQDALAQWQRRQGPSAMVGDGINDAPALARAHLGIAMGGLHSSAMAIETADMVLMNDDLRRIPATLTLARRAHGVLWQNIALALGIKALFFALALSGQASMWLAVVADMGVSLLVIANGLRLVRWR